MIKQATLVRDGKDLFICVDGVAPFQLSELQALFLTG
jgi:hypothetical protein